MTNPNNGETMAVYHEEEDFETKVTKAFFLDGVEIVVTVIAGIALMSLLVHVAGA